MAVMLENSIPPAPPITAVWAARPSVVVDWGWALFDGADCDEFPVRQHRFDRAPGMLERIRDFWADGDPEWIELVYLAHVAGCLWEREPVRILAGLRRVVDAPGGREVFDSETAENARIIRKRLRRLRNDPRLAERWLALIAEVAELLEPERERNWIVAETAARPLAAEGFSVTRWPRVEGKCAKPEEVLARAQEAVAAGGEAVVVPSRLGGKGFFLSFGELVLLGNRATGPIEPTDAARDVARMLRAMADPTRLTILEQLAIRPRRVGDLARDLALSQPTISNHVRLLRDAALVVDGPRGAERLLSVAPGAVEEALDRTKTLVVGTSSPLQK